MHALLSMQKAREFAGAITVLCTYIIHGARAGQHLWQEMSIILNFPRQKYGSRIFSLSLSRYSVRATFSFPMSS
jgi:hypothetical protein